MKIGIFKDSEAEYNLAPHLRASVAKTMEKSPGHYLHAKNSPPKENPAFDEGKVTHDVCLEQNTDRFIVLPEDAPKKPTSKQINAKKPSPETVAAIDWWKDFEAKNEGKVVIDQELRDSLDQRLNTFVGSKKTMEIYDGAEIEMSHYVKDPITGLMLKARPDISKPGQGLIADFKTTRSIEFFERDIWNLGYYFQVGFYSIVMEISTGGEFNQFKFIAQEKSAPYGVQVFSLDREAVDYCKSKARQLIDQIALCTEEEIFPIYYDEVRSVSVPKFVWAREFEVEEAV